jgi:hypothetical protein
MTRIGWVWLCVLWFAAFWSAERAVAQDEGTPTLHVYANTSQIPVLVLGAGQEPIKPIAANRFSVNVDSGPWFRATHVRQEGDDPITLGILLDENGSGAELMPRMAAALLGLVPRSLHTQDHVSLYALNCSLARWAYDMPANGEGMQVAVDHALASWKAWRGQKHPDRCSQPTHLWDALVYVTSVLQKLPGRGVILAVTEGDDKGSVNSWNQARAFAQATGVAVFGVTPVHEFGYGYVSMGTEDALRLVCELSGGMVMKTTSWGLGRTLNTFAEMVRERYIVEFPRPYNATQGAHNLQVKIDKGDRDFVRPAGISVPIPNAARRSDPMTVPNDPTKTPEMGTRKILTPQL